MQARRTTGAPLARGGNRFAPLAPASDEAPQALTTYRSAGFIKIFQANVRRVGPTNDAALQLAREARADVILIQEPWFNKEETHTKTHPAFHTFKPVTDGRPRVLTFVR